MICGSVFLHINFLIHEKTQLKYELQHHEFEGIKDVNFQILIVNYW